jgi:hypothetical protein
VELEFRVVGGGQLQPTIEEVGGRGRRFDRRWMAAGEAGEGGDRGERAEEEGSMARRGWRSKAAGRARMDATEAG